MTFQVCSAYKKHRFYLFTNAEPFMNDEKGEEGLTERDIFNEKPLKEDSITAIDVPTLSFPLPTCSLFQCLQNNEAEVRITEGAILHTSMGDIHIRMYARECPKTVENFCTHARRGYYNGHMFHRVIKSFMIQVYLTLCSQSHNLAFTDWRSDRQGHRRPVNLGRRFRRRIPSEYQTRQAVQGCYCVVA